VRRGARHFLAFVLCAVAFAACGDDDDGSTSTVAAPDPGPSAAAPDPARYCELSRELDRAGSEAFEALESDPNTTREDIEAAERSLVETNEDTLNEIQEVAPPEIQDQVATLILSLRARAGLTDDQVDRAAAAQAEEAIATFERQNCSV
jgi:hypothetical protein